MSRDALLAPLAGCDIHYGYAKPGPRDSPAHLRKAAV
jgi:hypothetical protein